MSRINSDIHLDPGDTGKAMLLDQSNVAAIPLGRDITLFFGGVHAVDELIEELIAARELLTARTVARAEMASL